jgi:hypothetical protein
MFVWLGRGRYGGADAGALYSGRDWTYRGQLMCVPPRLCLVEIDLRPYKT